MESITENTNRIGRFTSSEIHNLLSVNVKKDGFGKPALTYINEKRIERRLGRSIDVESNAKPLTWGKAVEKYVHEYHLPTSYSYCSSETIAHPEYGDFWAGSPDHIKHDEGTTVVDIKCPITLKSFCTFADLFVASNGKLEFAATLDILKEHPDGEKYYWQLVSNAILLNAKYAELVVFCPKRSELQAIRDFVGKIDGDQAPYFWIDRSRDSELPWIPDNGYYKNIYVFRFEVPESDKQLLTEKVKAAGLMLPKTLS